jgi:phosphoribosylanthranilate isomerase
MAKVSKRSMTSTARFVKVKICGITNFEDAAAAVEAGADLLGFIFYPPSPRSIGIDAAQELVAKLQQTAAWTNNQPPLLVGVFVDEAADYMAEILDYCALDLAQLSGGEVPSLIGNPGSPLYGRAYKVLKPTSLAEAEAEAEWFLPPGANENPTFPTLLLDTYHPTLPGGTGRATDWTMAARLAEQIPGLMLAGGLTPDNVAEAVRVARPYAVDVASGVEAAPGRKDQNKVRAFIKAAKER